LDAAAVRFAEDFTTIGVAQDGTIYVPSGDLIEIAPDGTIREVTTFR
jgi:hypothetical protein